MKYLVPLLSLLFCLQINAAQQVPFGDAVSSQITNYHRHRPDIATSGSFNAMALDEIKTLGFKTIIDLRTPLEDTALEADAAMKLGLAYHNLPIGKDLPTPLTVQRFSDLIDDNTNFPILVHCRSGNRVGLLWSLYQIEKGVSFEHSTIEGRTIGLQPKREAQLREHFSEESL